jgi:putative ABC transport system substrate-binding protein
LSSVALDLEGKRIEMLEEVVPKIASVAVAWDPANPYSALAFKEEQAAAQALGVRLRPMLVRDASDLESALSTMTRQRPDGLSLHGYTVVVVHRARIVDFAAKSRLPAVYPMAEYVDDGGLMSYGTSFRDLYRCAATYVDKILKGAKPADLPVEQPTKFELVINLKTAKQIGVTIPQTVLYRADKVIK